MGGGGWGGGVRGGDGERMVVGYVIFTTTLTTPSAE